MTQMIDSLKSFFSSAVISLIVLPVAQIACVQQANAGITVVNPNFQLPPVGQAAGGSVKCPESSPTIGWIFPCGPNGSSGVQLDTVFSAPNAPPPGQVAFIQNAGSVSQQIDFKYQAPYTLSFYVAAGANPGNAVEQLEISLAFSPQNLPNPPKPLFTQTVTPQIGSYSLVKIQLPIEGVILAGPQYVTFSNVPNAACTTCTNFIYGVSITAPQPIITKWPADISPTSTIGLEGDNFGPGKGEIELSFSPPAEVDFTGGGKTDLKLKAGNWADNAAKSEQVSVGSLIGAVAEQPVSISVITADGDKSAPVQAKFHNDAVITAGSGIIMPGQLFFLMGWDFDTKEECQDKKSGTVTIHFPTKSWQKFSNNGTGAASDSDLIMSIPTQGCSPDSIFMTLPSDTAGVVAQKVQITYQSPGGRKSNAWSAQFVPRLQMQVFTWEHVRVVSCSNQSAYDNCNNPNSTGFCWSGSIDVPGLLGLWPPDEDSMVGQHYGCWGLSSDNGTDVYSARIVNGWNYVRFSGGGTTVDNASLSVNVNPQVFNPDLTVVGIQVPWHIGASGGTMIYNVDIYVQGPAGVPPYE
jgi:hypothetical protein